MYLSIKLKTNKVIKFNILINYSYEASVRKKFEHQPEKLKIALSARRLLEQYYLSVEGAFDLNNVAAAADYVFYENDTDYSWQGIGYKTILDILIHKFPNESNALPFYEKLKLNEEVVKIRWNENSGVVVDVNVNKSYRGDRIIFTPSLNILKQDHKKLFVPTLSEKKQEAMQDIGLDAVMKIHSYFIEKWWSDGDDFVGYSFVWDETSLNATKVNKLLLAHISLYLIMYF